MIVVFLIYGAAFIALGISIFVFPKQLGAAPLALDLRWIGAFGFIHGANEWLDLLLLTPAFSASPALQVCAVVCLAVSFFCLVAFGVQALVRARLVPLWIYQASPLLLFGWLAAGLWGSDDLHLAAALARYCFGFPGAILTAAGLLLAARDPVLAALPSSRLRLRQVASIFLLYSVAAGLVVPRAAYFPASVLSYEAFIAWFGFPVQVVRAVCAFAIAIGLYRVLQLFEWELRRDREQRHQDLERRVSERTLELAAANAKLADEMHSREAMEEQISRAQKLESLCVLAGGIAHDYNNSLMAIFGNLSLAKMHAQPNTTLFELLGRCEAAGAQAQKLSVQLLTFAKGGLPVKEVFSPADLVRDTCSLCFSANKVRARVVVPADLWPVDADHAQLGQVVDGLCMNALEAVAGGPGEITVRCENVDGPEGLGSASAARRLVKIEVTDTGPGISPEHLDKIFDPFFTTKSKGRGLGLAVAHTIISRHGGRLEVQSAVGQGSTFTILLPAASDARLPKTEPGADEPLRRKLRVLVMDDDEAVREVAAALFHAVGCETEAVADGAAAVALFERQRAAAKPFDLVVLDLTVAGGMGGAETVVELQKLTAGVRAVVSSGYTNDPIMSAYRDHGFVGVLTKPYSLVGVKHLLRELGEL
ncbi:MAG: response regulator [Deltaproteobacteria bacterium]|nr:response regulator [Deltaproteobacteria bacterium]